MSETPRLEFVKVLLSGSRFCIPPAFVRHVIDDNHGKAIILSAGIFWHIKVQETEEGLFFTDGWEQMIKAHGLSEGCVLFFHYVGNMVFTLKVFGHSGCRINNFRINSEDSNSSLGQIPLANNCDETNVSSPSVGIISEDETSCIENIIQYEKKIHKTSLVHCRISVPLWVCASTGLKSSHDVTIRGPDRRLWTVFFSYSPQTPRLGKGWSEFCEHYKLEIGDSCIFTHVSKRDNLFDVKIKRVSHGRVSTSYEDEV
ncbi:putative B3 domain-containing protein Os04g0347400 [Dioscorea cayenensis subsp. rotundata]|uniref:B3 domain-containing protein Os04g0347400 n=1 Tax=Dioscorea cayennensis subsp. rotundata TaxID=55577 RepID=A0AB40CX36_DIOCR|nr:putative B3 domain-containing protein Os04g0347400 [Dioscorea cayenensis subsp. rotundata]XP_039143150.1 putative B3 domain-containing protein Os04g0347400 [Dioscorea cayenensis subsp. rotundata]